MSKWRITYDWCPEDDPGMGWAEHDYDTYEEKNLEEIFEGSWDEMQDYLVQMRVNGCYHIDVHEIYEYLSDED